MILVYFHSSWRSLRLCEKCRPLPEARRSPRGELIIFCTFLRSSMFQHNRPARLERPTLCHQTSHICHIVFGCVS